MLCLCFLPAAAASAASLAIEFDTEYSGGVAPASAAPWVVATFEDRAPGKVRLTISTAGLSARENLASAYFNLDPALAPARLAVRYAGGVKAQEVTKGADCCRAGPDGRYDLLFAYPAGEGFNADASSVYDLAYSGPGAFSAWSFGFLSASGGGAGAFYAAAHVQNTGIGSSAWIAPDDAPLAAPLPAPLAPLGVALALLFAFRRRSPRGRPSR